MNWKKAICNKKNQLIVFLTTLVLKLLCLCQSVDYGINSDRIGDFISPTAIAGLDWSLIIPDVNYYGYGFKWIYSIFFYLTDDPYIIYYCVMLLYIVLMSALAVLIYHMQIRYLKVESVMLAGFIAVFMGLVGPVDFKSEPSLYLACWVAAYLLLRALHAEQKREKYALAVILPLFLSYTLTLHERMLAIVLGFGIFYFLYLLKFRKWIFSPFIYLPVQVASYVIIEKLNDLYRHYFWGTQEISNTSALPSTLTDKLYFFQSLDGFKYALKCILSNIVTLCSQTYGLAWITLVIFVFSILLVWKKKDKQAECCTDTDSMLYSLIWFSVICVLIVIAGLVVSWSSKSYSGNLYGYKGFVYGRYYIIFIYPALMASLLWLSSHRMKLWQILVGWLGFAGMNAVFLIKIYPVLESAYYNYEATLTTSDTSLPWILFYTFSESETIYMNYIICLIAMLVVLFVITWTNLVRKYTTGAISITLFLAFLAGTSGFSFSKPEVTFTSGVYDETYQFIRGLEDIDEGIKEIVIYTDSWPWPLQYMLNRYQISYSYPDSSEEDILFVSTNDPTVEVNNLENGREYNYIQLAEGQYLYFKGEKCTEIIEQSGVEFSSMYALNITMDISSEESSAISQINDRVVTISGIEEEYTIVIVNDLHIIMPYTDVSDEYTETVAERYELMVNGDGVPSSENWLEMAKEINDMDADLVIFAGDMIDYASTANILCLQEGMDQIEAPIMYLRSDHDYSRHYTDTLTAEDVAKLQYEIDGDPDIWTWDMGEFTVLGINKSWKSISDEALAEVEALLGEGQPVLLATHVPYDSLTDAAFRQTSLDIRGVYNMWGLGDRYVPNDNMISLMEMIYAEDSSIRAVVAGHLHYQYDVLLTDSLMEYVFAPAYEGNIGVIHVVPAQE